MTKKNAISKYFSKLGKRSLKTMTSEQRKERAKKAVAQRWKNHNEKKS